MNQVDSPLERTPPQSIPAAIGSLDYPHSQKRENRVSIPTVLWALLIAFGILILVTRAPLHAPLFESLTQYVCDPLPRLPTLGNRSQSYSLNLRCRAGDQIVFQRQSVVDGSNPSGLTACRREGGLTRIWRMAPPSAYGAYVFHSTCGDHVIMVYKYRAAGYDSAQRFVVAVACMVILISALGLGRKMLHRARLNPT
jgi:hypothetical protein